MSQRSEHAVQTFVFADLSGFTALTEAHGDEALVTAATKTVAGQVAGVELRERGRWSFRNISAPVAVYAAVRLGTHSSSGLPIDPVCRMAVDPWHSAGRLTHQGVEYCFCSLECAGAFAGDPQIYTAPDRRRTPLPD